LFCSAVGCDNKTHQTKVMRLGNSFTLLLTLAMYCPANGQHYNYLFVLDNSQSMNKRSGELQNQKIWYHVQRKACQLLSGKSLASGDTIHLFYFNDDLYKVGKWIVSQNGGRENVCDAIRRIVPDGLTTCIEKSIKRLASYIRDSVSGSPSVYVLSDTLEACGDTKPGSNKFRTDSMLVRSNDVAYLYFMNLAVVKDQTVPLIKKLFADFRKGSTVRMQIPLLVTGSISKLLCKPETPDHYFRLSSDTINVEQQLAELELMLPAKARTGIGSTTLKFYYPDQPYPAPPAFSIPILIQYRDKVKVHITIR
jgi:hypothetical protein